MEGNKYSLSVRSRETMCEDSITLGEATWGLWMWCVLLKLQGWQASCQSPSHNLARLKHLYQVDKKWAALSCHTGPVYIINTTCTWNFRLGSTTAIDAKLCIIWTSKFKLVKGMGSGPAHKYYTKLPSSILEHEGNF